MKLLKTHDQQLMTIKDVSHELATLILKCSLFILLIGLTSCSSSKQDAEHSQRTRHVARATQGLADSANLGLLGLPFSMYQERAPNPNPYVGNLLFERYCDACHGSSKKGPDILKNRATASDAESDYYIIRYGIVDMPGFRTRLTKFQIFDIMAYMNDDLSPLIREQQYSVSSHENKP